MRTLLVATTVCLGLAAEQPVAAEPVSVAIPLHFVDPMTVLSRLPSTDCAELILINLANNTLTERPDGRAVAAFNAEAVALHAQPLIYHLKARLVHYRAGVRGQCSEGVAMSPTVITADKTQARITLSGQAGGFALLLTPSRDFGRGLTLLVEVEELGNQGEVVRSGTNTVHIAPGRRVRAVGHDRRNRRGTAPARADGRSRSWPWGVHWLLRGSARRRGKRLRTIAPDNAMADKRQLPDRPSVSRPAVAQTGPTAIAPARAAPAIRPVAASRAGGQPCDRSWRWYRSLPGPALRHQAARSASHSPAAWLAAGGDRDDRPYATTACRRSISDLRWPPVVYRL